MAYPPGDRGWPLGENVPMNLETIQANIIPTLIRHGDLHGGNVAIGDLVPGEYEHSIFPIVKVRDWFLGTAQNSARMELIGL